MKLYRIFRYEGSSEAKLDGITSKDPVSWLSIEKKDGYTFGKTGKIIVFQGNDYLMKSLNDCDLSFMEEIKGKDADLIMEKLKEESEKAAGGMGFLFE